MSTEEENLHDEITVLKSLLIVEKGWVEYHKNKNSKMLEALKSVSSDLDKLGFVDFLTLIKIKSLLKELK